LPFGIAHIARIAFGCFHACKTNLSLSKILIRFLSLFNTFLFISRTFRTPS
jgi:hypothetical protein